MYQSSSETMHWS